MKYKILGLLTIGSLLIGGSAIGLDESGVRLLGSKSGEVACFDILTGRTKTKAENGIAQNMLRTVERHPYLEPSFVELILIMKDNLDHEFIQVYAGANANKMMEVCGEQYDALPEN